jgi:hypothetical protein
MDSGMLARRSVLKQGMAMIAIVLLSVSGDDAMGGGPAHGPSWREVAARSQSFGPQDLSDAAERIEHLPPKVAAGARNLLAQMASVSLDAAGLRKALELLDRELPGYFKYGPAERPGQDHPHGTASVGLHCCWFTVCWWGLVLAPRVTTHRSQPPPE